jgi:hypothetical protein
VDVPAEQAAQALREVALEPPREYVLLGQGFDVPDDWPARQKYPAGQAACVELAMVAVAQKKPAEQGFEEEVLLPSAVQKPAVQDEHTDEPTLEKKPAPQRVWKLEPAAHAKPAEHCTEVVGVAQKKPAGQGLDVAVALPAAVQKPAPQLPHEDCAVKVVPPCEKVPAAHGFAVGDPVAGGQK